jgi:hypothetical protein
MSVIEAVTVTLYRVKAEHRPEGWRGGKPRRQRALAYRDAAWAKLRARCRCVYSDEVGGENKPCRYHDKQYRTPTLPYRDCWGYVDEGPETEGHYAPPRVWRLPRSDEPGFWDYGRAVAFRLARFYAHLDRRAPTTGSECQHKLNQEADHCRHGYAFGSTCEACIRECAGCWDDCASAATFGPRPSTGSGEEGT